MGVYIRLNAEVGLATIRDRLRARIQFGGLVWKAFQGWFYPSGVEFWRNASLAEVGGKQIVEPLKLDRDAAISSVMETIDALARKMSLDDLIASVILVKGIWQVENRSFVGHISINNAWEWRRMYQDIEIDAEMRTDDEDFADVILQSPAMGEGFINRFIEVISDRQSELAKLAAVYFFDGPFAKAEIYNVKSALYASPKEFVSDVLTSFRTELSETEASRLLSGLHPYRHDFLVSSLLSNQKFQKSLDADLREAEILQVPGHSILFLGKKKDSFRRAYELLKRDAFEKLARGLKPSEYVLRDIDNALGQNPQTGLDDDALRDSFDHPADDS